MSPEVCPTCLYPFVVYNDKERGFMDGSFAMLCDICGAHVCSECRSDFSSTAVIFCSSKCYDEFCGDRVPEQLELFVEDGR